MLKESAPSAVVATRGAHCLSNCGQSKAAALQGSGMSGMLLVVPVPNGQSPSAGHLVVLCRARVPVD